jgi:DNA repair protein RecO (recombination protein O)
LCISLEEMVAAECKNHLSQCQAKKMIEERTLAIVLRSRAHGESDKIVTFLTRDWGKVIGIAKGAKRSRRRFVNVLEPFTQVRLRFRPGRIEELAFIFGCDLVRPFHSPSRDLRRFAVASYATELIDVMIAGREAGPEAYELLQYGLMTLEEHEDLSPLFLPVFEFFLLTHVGYAPQLTACQQCGLSLDGDGSSLVFSPSRGGLLCHKCRGQGGTTLLLSTETLRLLEGLKEGEPRASLTLTASSRVCRETRALVSSILSRHLPRPLKSRAFLEQADAVDDSHIDGSQEE